jgi:hypothetical protein
MAAAMANSTEAKITNVMQQYFNYQKKAWHVAHSSGKRIIPENKDLQNKLLSVLSRETVNKTYLVDKQQLSPLSLAIENLDLGLATRLVTELGAEIPDDELLFTSSNVLVSLVIHYFSRLENSMRETRNKIVDVIALLLTQYIRNPYELGAMVDHAINYAMYVDVPYNKEDIDEFNKILQPKLRAAVREKLARTRRNLIATWNKGPIDGAQTRRHRRHKRTGGGGATGGGSVVAHAAPTAGGGSVAPTGVGRRTRCCEAGRRPRRVF